MSAFLEYSKLFKNGIVDAARRLNYSDSNICILKDDIGTLKAKHPKVYENLLECVHNRDKRTPLEYGRDLVASWIFEDTLITSLRANGLDIVKAGADQNREILAATHVSASSDSMVTVNSFSRPMEIMSDYTGWWRKTGHFELRDAKYTKLVTTKSLFLGVSTENRGQYFILDFAIPLEARYIESHRPYGWKPAYSIDVPTLRGLNIAELADSIRKCF